MVRPLHRKLLRDLARLKGQIITIALVVAAGIAAYVAMKGNYLSILEARDVYYRETRFADVFSRLERAPEHLRAQIESFPGVARVETRVAEAATVPMESLRKPVVAQILSVPPRDQRGLNDLYLVAGRWVESDRSDEAIVLQAFADAHGLGPGDTLPVVLDGTWRRLSIVGVASSPEYVMAIAPGSLAQDAKTFAVLWMGRRTLEAAFQMEGAFNDVSLELRRGVRPETVLDRLDRILEPYGGLGAQPRAKQLSNYIIEGELLQIDGVSNVVPLIFLAVAALLLNVVMSRLIHLQRPEIATLKAVGYTNREVGGHFLSFVLIIVGFGVTLGVGMGAELGSRLTEFYAGYFKFPGLEFDLNLDLTVRAVGMSLFAGIGGAFLAIRRVVVLPPAEAMRPAAPARYRRGVIDRLHLHGWVSPALHMILRELSRRPLRTLGSVLAIGASVGLLVVAGWYRDAVALLIESQFHEVMREDIMVSFHDARPAGAIRELAHLPGVLSAEGLRSVPVRFRNGHRYREGSLFGYADEGTLRQPRTKWGRLRTLPPSGLVITKTLGELLDAQIGDRLKLEIREGDRKTRSAIITGFVDEGFGLQGHMGSAALHELLQQEPMVSMGLLRVHPDHTEALERALKHLPDVASVTRKDEILEQFRAQSGQMLAVMTVLITAFGATLTVGVVYNQARIALSLRARDLASLRVLGYRRREISAILLGEMALQVVLALPFGLLFGRVLVDGIASTIDPENYRLPIIVTSASYGYAALVAVVASALSALLVRRKLDRLDLIGVLKTRE